MQKAFYFNLRSEAVVSKETIDYGKTLNLPKTEFPMRGNLPNMEPKMQAWWDEVDIYSLVQDNQKGKKQFILHDGPPYANGDIHIGHALNKVLKDFIVRFKTMQGYDAPYVPGWDTHGLPIEHAVVESKKIDRRNIDPIEFRDLCKDYALNYVDKQRVQFKQLGVRGDFDNPYITLEPKYEALQIKVFGDMAKKGLVYKGFRPVYWSPSSESALAEAEIEYIEKTSASIYVAFEVTDGKGIIPEGTNVIIWTTTPWTIPANLAIALNSDFDYTLFNAEGKDYIVAKEMLEIVQNEIGFTEIELINDFKGSELEGVITQHPFYDRPAPLILGEHVTLEAGTGFVHIAPGHGEDDFYVGQKYNLEILSPIDNQGRFTEDAPGFTGLFYDDANKEVTRILEEKGKLLKLSFINHQYAHDWRTKKPVIYRATEQWFASIEAIRTDILAAIKGVKWVPAWGEQRLSNMIAERGDWCVSRQRIWGVPIPIFYCEGCSEAIIEDATIDHLVDLVAAEGTNIWYARDASELLPSGFTCPKCKCASFTKEKDTMDVWFDSGVSHIAVLEERAELSWPADLYLEGSDQYRGWFNSSLTTSIAVRGAAPYRGVLSHGFTLDGEGRKMSKSTGNVIEPSKIINQLGADILRLWVASIDYQSDMRISDDILKQITEVYRKIRNTLRFLLSNLGGFNPATDLVPLAEMSDLDRFMMMKGRMLIDKTIKAYDKYEFNMVYQSIHNFFTIDLSSFYLDIVKDTLYTEPLNAANRKAVQTVIYEVLLATVKLIAPILPHTADEIWSYIPHVEGISVQLTEMPNWEHVVIEHEFLKEGNQLLDIRDEVLKALEIARKDKLIGNSLTAAVVIYPEPTTAKLLAKFPNLEKLFIVSQVEIKEGPVPTDATVVPGMSILVKLAPGEKCERCWNVLTDVGLTTDGLCNRCANIVSKYHSDILE